MITAGKSIGCIAPPFLYTSGSRLGRRMPLPDKAIIHYRQIDKPT